MTRIPRVKQRLSGVLLVAFSIAIISVTRPPVGAITLTAFGSAGTNASSTISTRQIVWSADFETGDNSQFNNGQSTTCQNGVIGVSSTIVHSGKYAGMYSGRMPPHVSDCREHPQEALPSSLTDFHWEMWIYVPTQAQTGWVSFATFNYITSSNPSISSLPFTIDASPLGVLHIDITRTRPITYVFSTAAFPYNSWFELSLDAHSVDTPQASLTLYLNGASIIQYQGQLLDGPLTNLHFGAYFGAAQPSWTVYNDDILVESLSGNGTSSTTSTSATGTNSSTSTTSVTSTTSTTTTSTTSTTTSSTTTIPSVTMTVSYSIVGGGIPTPPDFNYVQGGTAKSLPLTSTPTALSVDANTAWSVTPNPLTGSSGSQRWYSSQPLAGTASSTTIEFSFQHQYYLTIHVSPDGAGTVAPKSGWVNSGQTVSLMATANAGHKFKSWSGYGAGSYSGNNNPTTITINTAITETANFS